jgi:hypothetical protein
LTSIFLTFGLLAGRVFKGDGKRTTHILLALEALTAIWWLISCSVLARGASKLSDLGTILEEFCREATQCTTYEALTNIYGPAGTTAIGASKAAAAFGGVELYVSKLYKRACYRVDADLVLLVAIACFSYSHWVSVSLRCAQGAVGPTRLGQSLMSGIKAGIARDHDAAAYCRDIRRTCGTCLLDDEQMSGLYFLCFRYGLLFQWPIWELDTSYVGH